MGPDDLAQVLRPLHNFFPTEKHPDVLVGLDGADDAAVYQLNDEQAIIVTTDFFAPVVDDPHTYGAIAAANAMSDVYAMGGQVLLALNVAAFPDDLPHEVISDVLRGGAEKVAEAGGVVAGGHTMSDKEPKFGLAVVGLVHPDRIVTKAGAQPGDVLLLTKPLGVGLITTALKGEVAEPEHVEAAVRSMLQLNRGPARLMQTVGVHAATDVTGFGFLGHACEMATLSGVGLRIHYHRLPFLDGARRYAEEWLFPGGAHANRDHFARWIRFDPAFSEEEQLMIYDPETSGGLLMAVPGDRADRLRGLFADEGLAVWAVGEVVEGHRIEVVRGTALA